jgi:O-antigen/teichoic acid export membrane protein
MPGRIFSNSLFNLLGSALPAVVSILTIPFIVYRLGEVDYGILTMVTAIVGYFAIIDLNVTTGSVKYIAEYHAMGKRRELYETVSFGLITYAGIGLVGCALILASAEWLATHLFSLPQHLVDSSVKAIRLAAVGFVFGQLQSYLNSIPQALQRYDVSGKLEALFGSTVSIASVVVLWLGHGLYEVILVRVVLSTMNVGALVVLILRLLEHFRFLVPSWAVARRLLTFSGFVYMNTLASLFNAHADRLIIGSLIGMAPLTYYTVPATLISRILGLTFRLSSVVLPAASELSARQDLAKLKEVYFTTARYVFFINALVLLLTTVFAYEILLYWMGEEFASNGALVMVLIAAALVADSGTNLPALVSNGLGYPNIHAYFALVKVVIGLTLTFLGAKLYGIVGVAVGHLASAVLVTLAQWVFVHKYAIPFRFSEFVVHSYGRTSLFLLVAAGVLLLLKPGEPLGITGTVVAIIIIGAAYCIFGYMFVLSAEHRRWAAEYFRLKPSSVK